MAERRRTRRTTKVTISDDRGVFMISVAAELADMHPQTLRMYEQRGLIEPQRSPKGTRLYSQADVEKLRRIQEMTTDLGLNLAGVEKVMEMEQQLARAQRRLEQMQARADELQREIAGLEQRREEVRADLVRYESQPGSTIVRAEDVRPQRRTIRIERD